MSSSAEDDDLVDALAQASFATMAVLGRVGSAYDLSLTQVRVLGILRDRRLRMSALADHLGLERSTMTGLIARAEKRGLVRRTPHEHDRRAQEVSLTRAGARLVARLEPRFREALAVLTDELPPAERRRLSVLLKRMLATA